MRGKIIILVAPSGSGKTTIAKRLLDEVELLKFSISATTRKPRINETDGVDYHFLSKENFDEKITNNDFLEWEEFYGGTRYGTLQSEVEKQLNSGYFVLLDVEVKGALNVKKKFGSDALSIFIQPPSLEELKYRLSGRKSESEESLKLRLERAEKELLYSNQFDYVVVNDDLEVAFNGVKKIVLNYINSFKN